MLLHAQWLLVDLNSPEEKKRKRLQQSDGTKKVESQLQPFGSPTEHIPAQPLLELEACESTAVAIDRVPEHRDGYAVGDQEPQQATTTVGLFSALKARGNNAQCASRRLACPPRRSSPVCICSYDTRPTRPHREPARVSTSARCSSTCPRPSLRSSPNAAASCRRCARPACVLFGGPDSCL